MYQRQRGRPSRDFGGHGGIAGRAIGVRTERKIFRYALADHFELGLSAGALGDSGFDRPPVRLRGRPRPQRLQPFGKRLQMPPKSSGASCAAIGLNRLSKITTPS
jgi:hypothetical protein